MSIINRHFRNCKRKKQKKWNFSQLGDSYPCRLRHRLDFDLRETLARLE